MKSYPKSGYKDALLDLTKPRKEADWKKGEIEEEKTPTNFSRSEWHPEDQFDIKRVDKYKQWQLVETLKYGFREKGWSL